MQAVFFLCGVNPAGTTFVIRPVDPRRRKPFSPEFFLSEWDRKGPCAAFDLLGELLLGLLAVHYPAAFAARSLTARRSRTFPQDEQVASLDPFDWAGTMRAARLAVGMNYANDALRLAPYVGDQPDGFGESIALAKLDLRGAARAWPLVGEIVLGKVALMHPDAFDPFGNLTPGSVPTFGHELDPVTPGSVPTFGHELDPASPSMGSLVPILQGPCPKVGTDPGVSAGHKPLNAACWCTHCWGRV